MTSSMAKELITKKDVLRAWAKYYTCAEVSSGFERLTAPAFSFGMNDILKKLYGNNQEEYIKSLNRHLMFYNSEATWGSIIFGIACALEEERAMMLNDGATKEELDASADMISNLKVGLMGPLAGIGDTVNHGMLRPLLLSMFIPLAAAGSWLAGAGPLVIWTLCISAFAYVLVTRGYSQGKKSVTAILKSGKLNQYIQMASVLGLFMMGVLSSTYVKLSTAIQWETATGDAKTLQSVIGGIFPRLLPLLVVFGVYFYIKKCGPKYVRILIFILAISVVLSFFGIV